MYPPLSESLSEAPKDTANALHAVKPRAKRGRIYSVLTAATGPYTLCIASQAHSSPRAAQYIQHLAAAELPPACFSLPCSASFLRQKELAGRAENHDSTQLKTCAGPGLSRKRLRTFSSLLIHKDSLSGHFTICHCPLQGIKKCAVFDYNYSRIGGLGNPAS